MPSARKQRVQRKRESRRGLYILGAVVIIVVLAGVGWYLYASAQSANSPAIVYAKLGTSKGLIEVELYQSKTPKTVANFVNLAKLGFYDDLVWHRIVPGFVIQTGDPNSKGGVNNSTWGQGGSSEYVPTEIVSSLHNQAGYLGMAYASDPPGASSQFYINLVDNSASLDGRYAVFGRVIVGMDVVTMIASVPVYPAPSNQPITPVFLSNVTISNNA